ncbi:hypothetical protein FRB99_001286 [Tulasnella sp. 403]|nr:hypothetical protein FRB99_001286 [Tulasnella sp. 403]
MSDIEEALALSHEPLELRPSRSYGLIELVQLLCLRFQHSNIAADLDQAFLHGSEALTLCPPGNWSRSSRLGAVATTFRIRYLRDGTLSDLDKAVAKYQETMECAPPGDRWRSSCFSHLAASLRMHFERTSVADDLSPAVALSEDAVRMNPRGHPGRASTLQSLIAVYQTRFIKNRTQSDLVAAIDHARELLGLHTFSDTTRYTNLAQLSTLFRLRFSVEGDISDLDIAVRHAEEAVELCPATHLHRRHCLDALANALVTRFEISNGGSDLDQAIAYHKDALGELDDAISNFEASLSLCPNSHQHFRRNSEYIALSTNEDADRSSHVAALALYRLQDYKRYRRLATEWESVVHEIHTLPGFQHFLIPTPYTDLPKAAAYDPVITINTSKNRCDALIVLKEGPPHFVPLPKATREDIQRAAADLTGLAKKVATGGAVYDHEVHAVFRAIRVPVVAPISKYLKTTLKLPEGSRV